MPLGQGLSKLTENWPGIILGRDWCSWTAAKTKGDFPTDFNDSWVKVCALQFHNCSAIYNIKSHKNRAVGKTTPHTPALISTLFLMLAEGKGSNIIAWHNLNWFFFLSLPSQSRSVNRTSLSKHVPEFAKLSPECSRTFSTVVLV